MTPRPGRAGTRVPEHVRAALAARLGAESLGALARAAKTSDGCRTSHHVTVESATREFCRLSEQT